jgi:hypothetical protein
MQLTLLEPSEPERQRGATWPPRWRSGSEVTLGVLIGQLWFPQTR